MPLVQKTFTKVISNSSMEEIENAFASIDQEVNEFFKNEHWSQARDCFQSLTTVNDALIITRTLVYTTEQLAFAPGGKPPVGPQQ